MSILTVNVWRSTFSWMNNVVLWSYWDIFIISTIFLSTNHNNNLFFNNLIWSFSSHHSQYTSSTHLTGTCVFENKIQNRLLWIASLHYLLNIYWKRATFAYFPWFSLFSSMIHYLFQLSRLFNTCITPYLLYHSQFLSQYLTFFVPI